MNKLTPHNLAPGITPKSIMETPSLLDITNLLTEGALKSSQLSQDEPLSSELDATLSQTLALVKENLELSVQIFGESESLPTFSQESNQSLTEYLDMMEQQSREESSQLSTSQEKNKKHHEFVVPSTRTSKAASAPADVIKKSQKSKKAVKEQQAHQVPNDDKRTTRVDIIREDKSTAEISTLKVTDNKLEKEAQDLLWYNQPPKNKTDHTIISRQKIAKLLTLQKLRDVGLYVICDSCNKTRYLPDVKDPLDLPEKWYCRMNPDPKYNTCKKPDYNISAKEKAQIIINKYHAGSLVWAKNGSQWWPGIIDDNPEAMQYFWMEDYNSDIPTWYHVTFFGTPETPNDWVKTEELEPFRSKLEDFEPKNCESDLKDAIGDAKAACDLSVLGRLGKFSYLKRYILDKQDFNQNKKRCREAPDAYFHSRVELEAQRRASASKPTRVCRDCVFHSRVELEAQFRASAVL